MAAHKWDNGEWELNLQRTKAHLAVYGYTGNGTGIVAACDKKGIFLRGEAAGDDVPRCRTCSRMVELRGATERVQ